MKHRAARSALVRYFLFKPYGTRVYWITYLLTYLNDYTQQVDRRAITHK